MKKVLFVATVTKHINVFHIPYLKWFKEQGYEVHVASKGNEKIEYCDKHFNLPFERFPLKINNIKTYKELKRIIDNNNYDIIHCHTPVGGVLARLAARKARKKGTKVLYTAHGFHFFKGAPLLNWLIYYPIEKIMAHYTNCLITIVNEDYEFAKKHLKVKDIKHINGIGMNVDRFSKEVTEEQKEKLRKELKINIGDTVFCYVAELNKNKNQIILLNTIQQLKKEIKNIKLLLVGDGPKLSEYKENAKIKGIEDNVIFLGKRKDINEILSITNIYVASSMREGLPINIIEAMYKGLPIVATSNRGHKELIENEKNGFIANTAEEMAQKIKEIINNKKLYEKIREENFNKAKKYLSTNIVKDMEKIYREVLSEK